MFSILQYSRVIITNTKMINTNNKIFKEYPHIKTAGVTYISKMRNFIGPWKNKTDLCCNTSDVTPTMSIHIYTYTYGTKNLSILHNFIHTLFIYLNKFYDKY